MTIEEVMQNISNAISLKTISPTSWKIESKASFLNGNKIAVYLENKNGNWIFTDEKETLKYMNELYELKSADVKMCISNILKIYGFSITAGQLIAHIPSLDVIMEKYFDFLMCIGQLSNMFAFFDKP